MLELQGIMSKIRPERLPGVAAFFRKTCDFLEKSFRRVQDRAIRFVYLEKDGTAESPAMPFGVSQKSEPGAFSMVTLRVAILKLPVSSFFASHPKSKGAPFASTVWEKERTPIYSIFLHYRVGICEKVCYFKTGTRRKDSAGLRNKATYSFCK